jgi:hypothetical protein
MSHGREISLTIVSIILSVISIEIGLQLLDYPPRPAMGWDWSTSAYKDNAFNSDEVNQLGYRGQPIKYDDGDFVVLLLGSSTVEAGVQPQAVQPERILQFILQQHGIHNARVFSIASAGWGFDQQLIALREYFSRYRANTVVHWLAPPVDFWQAGNIDRSVTSVPGALKPTFVLADDGALSPYSIRAFRLKIWHLVSLALNRFTDKNWGNSSIAVNEYEETLPSPARSSVPINTCPPEGGPGLFKTTEALERSRSHVIPALEPLSERDAYFIRLAHSLQEEIEKESTRHSASYIPVIMSEKEMNDAMKQIKCVVDVNSGSAYRFDFNNYNKLAYNPLIKVSLSFIEINRRWFNYVSDSDFHFNLFGNFDALNILAAIILERSNFSAATPMSTQELIHRSKLLAPTGVELDFGPRGLASSQPLRGFYKEESNGRWTNGDATVMFDVRDPIFETEGEAPMMLEIYGHALVFGSQKQSRLQLLIDDKVVGETSLTQGDSDERLCVRFIRKSHGRFLSVGLRTKDLARPVDLGLGGDIRRLGFYVRRLRVASADDAGECDGRLRQ